MQVTDNLRLLHNFLKKNIVEALIFYENKFLFQLHFLFAIVRKSTLLSKRCTHKTNMKSIRGSGCRELSLPSCSGVWNKPPRKKKKWKSSGVCPKRMVTGQIKTGMHKERTARATIERKFSYSSACWPRFLRSIICGLSLFTKRGIF